MHCHMVLQRTDANGSTLFDHCEVIQQRTGIWPEEYPRPEIPDAGCDIWDWYWQLRQAAAFGVSGPGPLAYTEIEAWSRLLCISLGPMDIRLLFALDRTFLDCWYDERKKKTPKT